MIAIGAGYDPFEVDVGCPLIPDVNRSPVPAAVYQPLEPLVENEISLPEYVKDWFDHLADYFNPGDGPWDYFRFWENLTAYAPYFSLDAELQNLLSRIRGGADLFGSAMSIPKFFKNISDLRQHVYEWKIATLSRIEQKTAEAWRKVRYDIFNAINTASQAALCLNNARIINLSSNAPLVNGVNQATTILTDGQSMIDEIDDIKAGKGDKTVKVLRVAKYLSSVVLATLILVGIFYAALLQQLVFVVLFLCSVYVLTSILSDLVSRSRQHLPIAHFEMV